jgi:hypothetical protein
MTYKRLLAASVCASLFSLSVLARPGATPVGTQARRAQNQEEKKVDKELEQKALAMLDELIAEAPAFKLPENRVRILSVAADMLWQYDEKRARALIVEAMSSLGQLIHQPEDAPDVIPENFRWYLSQLRQETVQAIAAHDAQLAGEFLAATRPDVKSSLYNPENEAQFELTLAQQSAHQDPKKALQIAKERLATAKNPNVVSGILYSLREKDAAAAQELADCIMAKLRTESPLSYESASFAINLISLAPPPSPPQPEGDGGIGAAVNQPKSLITPAIARELIEKALAALQTQLATARQQTDQSQRYNAVNLMNQLKSWTAYIEKYAPSSVAALKRIAPQVDQIKDVNQRRWDDLNALAEKGSPEALLEAVSRADPGMKGQYYQRAAQMIRDKGDDERARQIINDNITDPNQRRQALREMDQQKVWKAIGEGKFDEARGMLPGLRGLQERVNALTQMASAALNAEKKELAAQLLDEAWGMVDGPAESSQQFNAQLQIAIANVKLRPARSFEIIAATVEQYNELFAASATIESFDQHGTFREKEMILRNGGGRASSYLYQYGQSLAELARTDLAHVQAVVNQFSRPEVRTSIRMLVLQQILRGQQPPSGFGEGRGNLILINRLD